MDIEGFVTDFLKLPLLYRSFAEEDSDKIGFIADGVTPLRVYEGGTVVRRVYPGGTIVIERCLRQEHESGRRQVLESCVPVTRLTLAIRKFFVARSLRIAKVNTKTPTTFFSTYLRIPCRMLNRLLKSG